MYEQQLLPEAHSYANYQNAAKKVKSVIADGCFDNPVRWFVIAQEDGRFSPAVLLSGKQMNDMHYFLHNNVAVLGG